MTTTIGGLRVDVRAALPRDTGFVVDSFVECFRASHWSGVLPMHTFSREHRRHMSKVMADRASTYIAVAADEPDPGLEILGCLVCEPAKNVAHWCYVKKDLRGHGIARLLVECSGLPADKTFTCSTRTPDLDSINEHRILRNGASTRLRHDPRYLRDHTWQGPRHGKAAKNPVQVIEKRTQAQPSESG